MFTGIAQLNELFRCLVRMLTILDELLLGMCNILNVFISVLTVNLE